MEKIDYSNLLFRCHALGNLMTESKKKDELLSETTKSYLLELDTFVRYKRRKTFSNKFTEKGLANEEEGITLLSKKLKTFLIKNNVRRKNEFIEGEYDVIKDNHVYDNKCSFDIHTFRKHLFDTKIDKGYYWQGQGYLALTGADKFSVCYTLTNTPDEIVQQEIRKANYAMGSPDYESEEFQEVIRQIEFEHNFDDIPNEERVIIQTVERNDVDIQLLYDKIIICREYMNETFNNLNYGNS